MDSLSQEIHHHQMFAAPSNNHNETSSMAREKQHNFNISAILGHLTTISNTNPALSPPNINNNSDISSNQNHTDDKNCERRQNEETTTMKRDESKNSMATTTNGNLANHSLGHTISSSDNQIISKSDNNGINSKITPRHSMQRKQSVFSLDGSPIDPHNNNSNNNSKLIDGPSNITPITKQTTISNINDDKQHQLLESNNISNTNNNIIVDHNLSTNQNTSHMNTDSDYHRHADIFSVSNKLISDSTSSHLPTTQHKDHHHVSSSSSNHMTSNDSINRMFIPDSSSHRCTTTNAKPHCMSSDINQDFHQHQKNMEIAVDTSDSMSAAPNAKNHLLQQIHHQTNNIIAHQNHQSSPVQKQLHQQEPSPIQSQQQLQQHPPAQMQQQPMDLQHFKRNECNLGSNGSSRASSCDEQQALTSSLSSSSSSELASTDPTLDDPDSNQSTKTFTGTVGEPSLPTPQLDSIQKHLRRKSMPNPDLIGQHISNIISQNQAIVDNFNPWTRKNYAPRDSKPYNTGTSSTESASNNPTLRKRWSTSSTPRYIFGSSIISPSKTQKYNHGSAGVDFQNPSRRLSTGRLASSRNRSSTASQEQPVPKVSAHNLMESKLEYALRGIACKNLDPQIFQQTDYSILEEMSNQSAVIDRQEFRVDGTLKHLQEQNARISKINESDLLSSLSISSSKTERMYDSVDSLVGAQNLSSHKDIQEENDRRYSLNSYPIHPGFELNCLDTSLLEKVAQNAALLKQLELQQLRLRQLSMMNHHATYSLAEAFMSPTITSSSSENPFMAKRDPVIVNQNLGLRIQSQDSMISNSGLDSSESAKNLYKESVMPPQSQSNIDQRLRAQQERDHALMRDFLISIQNNRCSQQHLNPSTELSHLIDSNQQNLKNLTSTVSNPLGNSIGSCVSRPTPTSMSCNDDLCKDYSLTTNNHPTQLAPNEGKIFNSNLNQINVCNLCKTAFRDWDTLVAHQKHYCRLSIPDESAMAKDIATQDSVQETQKVPLIDELVSQKSRRNSSALGDLADKVKNVFVSNRIDQLYLPESSFPMRDSKSISPTPVSVNLPERHNIDSKQASMGISPASPGKQQSSILKQQLLVSSVTPRQTLPPKKRKISEPNLKIAGFNVGSSTASPCVAFARRGSPDQGNLSILEKGGILQSSKGGSNISINNNFVNESRELDLSTKGPMNNAREPSVDDGEDLYEGSDNYNISKKQCSPTRSTACMSPGGAPVNHYHTERDSLLESPGAARPEDYPEYVPRVLDVCNKVS